MENPNPAQTELDRINEFTSKIRKQISTRLIGQEKMIDLLLIAILAKGHTLIEGVPGLAKTMSVRMLAATLGTQFSRIQFTPDLMPSDVTGTMVFNQKTGEFEFHKGPVFSNLVLIDEINRSPAKTQSSLFEVMEEKQISTAGKVYPLEPPFHVFATQNPVEYEGTYKLPEAQLDRFLLKINVEYPGEGEELNILKNFKSPASWQGEDKIEPVVTKQEIIEATKITENIHAGEKVLDYVNKIVRQTRNSPLITLGASPRASLSLVIASRALAAMEGRDYITPEDVQYLSGPVLAHRILPEPEQELEGKSNPELIEKIVQEVTVPR